MQLSPALRWQQLQPRLRRLPPETALALPCPGPPVRIAAPCLIAPAGAALSISALRCLRLRACGRQVMTGWLVRTCCCAPSVELRRSRCGRCDESCSVAAWRVGSFCRRPAATVARTRSLRILGSSVPQLGSEAEPKRYLPSTSIYSLRLTGKWYSAVLYSDFCSGTAHWTSTGSHWTDFLFEPHSRRAR